jgi:hypothetical protein
MSPESKDIYNKYLEDVISHTASGEKVKDKYIQAGKVAETGEFDKAAIIAEEAKSLTALRKRLEELHDQDDPVTTVLKEFGKENTDFPIEIRSTAQPPTATVDEISEQYQEELQIEQETERKGRKGRYLDIWQEDHKWKILHALIEVKADGSIKHRLAKDVGKTAMSDNSEDTFNKHKDVVYGNVKAVRVEFTQAIQQLVKAVEDKRGYQVQNTGDLISMILSENNIVKETNNPQFNIENDYQVQVYQAINQKHGELHPNDFLKNVIWRGKMPKKLIQNDFAEETEEDQ